MSNRIGYIAPVIGFLAALVALLGPSRRPDHVGFAAITPFGWTSATFAAISLGVGLITLHRRDVELAAARATQARLRAVAFGEIGDGLARLDDVLRYAALVPWITVPRVEATLPASNPFRREGAVSAAAGLDLAAPETLDVLRNVYLSPVARLSAPFIPAAIPFGTDVVRPAMNVIAEESGAAARMVETAVQKYAATSLPVEVIESASAILRSPFLKHLQTLRESWQRRSAMEDSNSPRSLNFRFVDSGITGGSSQDYLRFVEEMTRLGKALAQAR